MAEPRKRFLKHRGGAVDEIHMFRWQIAEEQDGGARAERTAVRHRSTHGTAAGVMARSSDALGTPTRLRHDRLT